MKNESKILIIEDDMLLNDMTKRLLTQHGYCVTSAYSGSEALLLIEKGTFDLILLDLMLPGIPGETVLEKMKSTMDIPIIGVSAKTDIDSKVNLIRNGADDYITKPFDNQELLVRIEAVLRRFQKSTTPNNSKILRFSQLSLGMRQRLGIARAFLGDVQYLLLDEPTNGLDPMGIKEIRLLLKERLKSPQHCILVSSHNLTEIAAVTDVLIFIRGGKIIKIVKNDYNEKELEALYEDIMTSGQREDA